MAVNVTWIASKLMPELRHLCCQLSFYLQDNTRQHD
jgi:hypothetical protein